MMPFPHAPIRWADCVAPCWGTPIRECRKEPKELLVEPEFGTASEVAGETTKPIETAKSDLKSLLDDYNVAGILQEGIARGVVKHAVVGGGCCVQISVEYMPSHPVVGASSGKSIAAVVVIDSEGSVLGWGKAFQEGYHVKESIITTYPGARLIVVGVDAYVRVRWSEIFSY